MRSLSSEWVGDSRDWEPAVYLSPCRQVELRVGRRDSPRMEDARATGRGGNVVRTVSSLGSAGSGLAKGEGRPQGGTLLTTPAMT